MTQFLVKFKTCAQVGPDNWDMVSIERLFDENAKISDIKDWIIERSGYTRNGEYKRMVEVQLSEPETTTKPINEDDMPY